MSEESISNASIKAVSRRSLSIKSKNKKMTKVKDNEKKSLHLQQHSISKSYKSLESGGKDGKVAMKNDMKQAIGKINIQEVQMKNAEAENSII